MKNIDQFSNIPTTCVSDGLQGINHMDMSIKPIEEHHHITGPARTVAMVPGDNLVVLKAIRAAQPGDILVIDAKGDTHLAIAGDFVVGMAKTMGVQAIIVDGVIRDVASIKDLDFPVFCKGVTVAAGNKYGKGQLDGTIHCGGVVVQQGDMIVGDIDGVVVVPQDQAESVLEKALEKMEKDEAREQSVSGDKEKVMAYLDKVLSKFG